MKLGAIRFVDAAGVNPKVMQAVTLSLFTAELYLAITSLALARAVYQILKGDLLRSPSVRKYSILWDIAPEELRQAEIAVAVIL